MNPSTKVRQFILMIFAISVALMFSSCKPSSDTAENTPATKQTIRLIGEAYAPLDALDAMRSRFTDETGIDVEIVRKSHTDVVAELSQDLASGRTSYDLILMPHRLLGRFVESGQVVPLDAMLSRPEFAELAPTPGNFFEPWFHEISWYEGKQYGYPFTTLTMFVVYRKDLFEDESERREFSDRYGKDLAPPRTWDEYRDIVEFFNRPDEDLYGTYINGQHHVALWYEWLNFVYGFGGDPLSFDETTGKWDVRVNSPEIIAATEYYVSLLQHAAPESLNYNWDDALALMQQGRAAMGLMWSDSVPYLEIPEQSEVAGKIGYSTIPTVQGGEIAQLEGWTYLIPKESKHQEAALRFMLWAMQPEVQVAQMLGGGASPQKPPYDNLAVKQLPYVPAFLASVPVARPKPRIPESGELTERAVRRLANIISGAPVQRELDQLAAEYRDLLSRSGKP